MKSYLQENLPPTRRPWKWNHLCPFLHTVTECLLSSPISSTTVGIVTGDRVPPQEFPKMAKTKTINSLRWWLDKITLLVDKLTRPNLMKLNVVTFGSFFILNTIWILAQSAFNSVLFGRQTSPLISEPLCLEVVPPPLHSAHCLQGGFRHPTFSFGTHFPPGGHFPASLMSKQLLAPQSIPVQWRSPSKHRQLLQSSCTVELWSWIVPSLSLQFLVSFSSSTTKVFSC